MAQVQCFGTWTYLGGTYWNGTRHVIPRESSMKKNVDLKGVSAITFTYHSDLENWSHLIVYIDGVSVFDQQRSTNIPGNRSFTVNYTGIHEVKFYAHPDMIRACCIKNPSALATVFNTPIISSEDS